ncbi:F-box protein VBF-like [Bidens hawaiensis]|uniref:F-box protein VBF-like n=1 Tax=Bidens hawaiensis TaxID=980011 RepID=UPI00404B5006
MATRLNMLPEDCVSTVLSLTSPPEACRFLLVSSSLRSAAESDIVWDRFLPSDILRILSRSHTQLNFTSKKQLFIHLCGWLLIDGGIRSFSLDKVSGRKSCFLSARALSISLSNESNHWTWTANSTSRFSEVVELKTISNMEIEGRIQTEDLSINTTYCAYLVVKVSDRSFGLDSIPCETSISSDTCSVTNKSYLCPLDEQKQQLESLFFMNRRQMMDKRVVEGECRRLSKRGDGWMEIELGEFFVREKCEMVKMNLSEVKGNHLKGGLTIQGIEVRPKYKQV